MWWAWQRAEPQLQVRLSGVRPVLTLIMFRYCSGGSGLLLLLLLAAQELPPASCSAQIGPLSPLPVPS
jgi:hypothetical protein